MLLKLADTVLILINTGPSNVNMKIGQKQIQPIVLEGRTQLNDPL